MHPLLTCFCYWLTFGNDTCSRTERSSLEGSSSMLGAELENRSAASDAWLLAAAHNNGAEASDAHGPEPMDITPSDPIADQVTADNT